MSTRRQGAVVLELLLTFPVFLIALLAIVQFGFLFQNHQQLALACRVGTEEASETVLPGAGGMLPVNVEEAILQQMSSANLEPCRILLQHNTGGPTVTITKDYTPACMSCTAPSLASFPLPADSVRVTICVHLVELMPNCLSSLGFDISDETARCVATFGHE